MIVAGCRQDVASIDGAFYNGDQRKVHCAVNLDNKSGNMPTIDDALGRAVERNEVIELYAHKPGGTIDSASIDHVLSRARELGLAFVTYADMANGIEMRPGLALSFDDAFIPQWYAIRPLLAQYEARVTFFISRYDALAEDWYLQIRDLAADGHDIEAHSILHLRAPTYVEDNGLGAYLKKEALPSIELLRDDGYDVTTYAYPFGARTNELDDALLGHVKLLRSVAFSLEGAVDPCPH